MYYALTLVVTTSVTVTEVLVLELHFRSNYGVPMPAWLVRMASWMAALTFTKLDFSPSHVPVLIPESGDFSFIRNISEEQTELC